MLDIFCSLCGEELGVVASDVTIADFIYCQECYDKLPKDGEFSGTWDAAIFRRPFVDICLQGGGGGIVMAHKAVLAGKSKVFKEMLSSGMSECLSAKVEVPDMTTQELQPFVQFLYAGFISENDLRNHAIALYKASEKYDIPFLKSTCECFLMHNVFRNVDGVFEIAKLYNSKRLQREVLPYLFHENFVKNNSAAVVVKAFRDATAFEGYKEYRKKHPRKIASLMEIAVCQIADCMMLEDSGEVKQTNDSVTSGSFNKWDECTSDMPFAGEADDWYERTSDTYLADEPDGTDE